MIFQNLAIFHPLLLLLPLSNKLHEIKDYKDKNIKTLVGEAMADYTTKLDKLLELVEKLEENKQSITNAKKPCLNIVTRIKC